MNAGTFPRRRRLRRSGVVTLWTLAAASLVVLLAVWLLNLLYWQAAARTMQQRLDAIVLAAAPRLLDEDRLFGGPGDAGDDVAEALAEVERQRLWNNGAGPAAFALAAEDVQPQAGWIDQPTAPRFVADDQFVNALRLRGERSDASSNPLGLLLAGWTKSPSPRLRAEACAVLDDLLVGWRPRNDRPAPLAPIAIELSAWRQAFGGAGVGASEALFRVAPVGDQGTAALVGFDGGVDLGVVRSQLGAGVFPQQIAGRELGPVTAGEAPVVLIGMNNPSARDAAILSRLTDRIPTDKPLAFCVYAEGDALTDGDAGEFRVLGFVAATVHGADVSGGRLEFVLAPAFLIDPTAWTEPWAGERNLYIHKLRLVH